MTFLILSDIHGSAECLETALASFENKVDAIIMLGDYLNHGPRNPLPQGWDAKRTAELLNERKEKLICVRGNCDSEVDEMMLTFPCLNAYSTIALPTQGGIRRIFLHHGHLYDRAKLSSWLPKGTIVLSGHTHVGQIFPLTLVTAAMYVTDHGMWQQDVQSPVLLVTSGVDYWGPPMRVGSDAEIAVIDMRL